MNAKRFRIAFSFAGEKRKFVAKIAALLAKRFGETAILYDKYHEAEFARHNLGIYLPELYHKHADLVVVVACANYEGKEWCGLEWAAIHDLLKQRKNSEVMFSRFHKASIGGIYSTTGWLELDRKSPEQAAALILERLALNEKLPKSHYTNPGSVVAPTLKTASGQLGNGNTLMPAVAHGYDEMIERAFNLFMAQVQEARSSHIEETKLRQAGLGYVGKSTGEAQLLGKAIVASNAKLAEDLIQSLDRNIFASGADVPADAAEKLGDRFTGVLHFLGELPIKSALEYLGDSSGIAKRALLRIGMAWTPKRIKLEQEFALMVRKHRARAATETHAKPSGRPRQSQRIRKVQPAPISDFDPEQMSNDAKRLLYAMSEAKDGRLLRSRAMDGYSLTIDDSDFLANASERRVIARWERTIKDLLGLGLIEREGRDDDIFVITDEGYQAVDECGLIP